MPESARKGRGARNFAGALAAALAALGLTMIGFAVTRDNPEPPVPPAPAEAVDRAVETAPEQRTSKPGDKLTHSATVPELGYSAPARVRIPSIGVDSTLVELGLDPDGVMETPEPVESAGWFKPSPPPGLPGATVITGHVTWNQEPVVFFELGSLRPGDLVEVDREDGKTTTFEVTRIGTFPKDEFPTAEVYDQPPRSELRLITCGGEYDPTTHSYPDNVIVWAKIIGVRAPKA